MIAKCLSVKVVFLESVHLSRRLFSQKKGFDSLMQERILRKVVKAAPLASVEEMKRKIDEEYELQAEELS